MYSNRDCIASHKQKLTNDLDGREQAAWNDDDGPDVQVDGVHQDDAHVPRNKDEENAEGQDLDVAPDVARRGREGQQDRVRHLKNMAFFKLCKSVFFNNLLAPASIY